MTGPCCQISSDEYQLAMTWCISMVGELLLESAISAEASGHV
jgi:hypothetical protein